MNKSALRSYAPQARRDFIAAVTARANLLGLSSASISPAAVRGDVCIIEGREWPAKVAMQRDALSARIRREGFEQTIDAVAYTWFNRFAALRFLEVHEYLVHGYRVLSSRDGGLPEILRHVSELEFSGIDSAQAREMQLVGNKDNELYRMILLAECNQLSRAMPFLFERIDDETELLLPDNLLRTDSVISKLVGAIDESDWQEVEILGWLYQFYIGEEKERVDQKIKKGAKIEVSEIPAKTQLFTPNWTVQFLVQNTIGRLWLNENPASPLKSQWPYLMEAAEQTVESKEYIERFCTADRSELGTKLSPEQIALLDPACGSGHILIEAYELLKAIYIEQGYQLRAIPRLILERNLYGLEIDERAAQLAGFALLMKARADDRRILEDPPCINVLPIRHSDGLSPESLANDLSGYGIERNFIELLVETFAGAKVFGSLIEISAALQNALPHAERNLEGALASMDMFERQGAERLLPLIAQARVLSRKFDAVVANPPYLGSKYFPKPLKSFTAERFAYAKGDLYACFMIRNAAFVRSGGLVGMITIPTWMFSSGFADLREQLLGQYVFEAFCHNGRGVFGSDFGSCSFAFRRAQSPTYRGRYKRLFEKAGSVASNEELANRFPKARLYEASARDLRTIPGTPIAYWATAQVRRAFQTGTPLGSISKPVVGLQTGDNARFIRRWSEVSLSTIEFSATPRASDFKSNLKWFPYTKGGDYRKWYGNLDWIVNWQGDGEEVGAHPSAVIRNRELYFREGASYTNISSSRFAARMTPQGFIFDQKGSMLFSEKREDLLYVMAVLHSSIAAHFLSILCPGVDFNPGDLARIPIIRSEEHAAQITADVEELVTLSAADWNAFEISWDFQRSYWLDDASAIRKLSKSWAAWQQRTAERLSYALTLEESIDRILVDAYGLTKEVLATKSEDEITLSRAERDADCRRLVSYIMGCMMGRHSLDEGGLIYAHAANEGFDARRYKTYPADADGIVVITNEPWFDDDAPGRVREFLRTVWGAEELEENMSWLAEALGAKSHEPAVDGVRSYLAEEFYRDHLQAYKRRPIYWLFTSGKQGAFQALVYLHRYHEGTLARMRTRYVVPLVGKIASRIELLQRDEAASASSAARTRIRRQLELLQEKVGELLAFDEKLRHYADMRIKLDLDDGVKVNYAKFDDLVAESKKVTGGSDE